VVEDELIWSNDFLPQRRKERYAFSSERSGVAVKNIIGGMLICYVPPNEII
jgi:hypothetical protein